MMMDNALRATETLLGLAFIQQGAEHLAGPRDEKILSSIRIILSITLIAGIGTNWVCPALALTSLCMLVRFQGPYNGGSDRMGTLILLALTAAKFLPPHAQEYAIGYLAMQVTLSYFMAGWVKIKNPDWRRGRALQDVFLFSVYPASEHLRALANHRTVLCAASWAVMLFELMFPLTLASHTTLVIGLVIAAAFHLANACLFGLNRFVWVWVAAYPSLLWLQERLSWQ